MDQSSSSTPEPQPVSTPAPEKPATAGESSGDVAGASALAEAQAQVAAAKKEASEHYDRYLRLAADMENLRKRTLREKDELRQFAAGRVLEDLLPVLDNLGLGLQAAKAPNGDLKNLIGGLTMVLEQLKSSLSSHGLKEINPVQAPFDPNQHEAISSQPSADVAEGSVVQVVRIGYSLNGRLLRPASVVVSTGAEKPTVV